MGIEDILFSKEQIEEDIFQFEGVRVVLGEKIRYCDRLYSHCFTEPMDGKETVDDLKRRVAGYLKDHVAVVIND